MDTESNASESLELQDLGKLAERSEDDLLWLRERLVMDVERIHEDNRQVQQQLKDLSRRKQELQQEHGQRAKALRAVKHELRQRARAATLEHEGAR